nr:hypothetical protein Iba_chr03dCG2710 [Ipomoea batatas]
MLLNTNGTVGTASAPNVQNNVNSLANNAKDSPSTVHGSGNTNTLAISKVNQQPSSQPPLVEDVRCASEFKVDSGYGPYRAGSYRGGLVVSEYYGGLRCGGLDDGHMSEFYRSEGEEGRRDVPLAQTQQTDEGYLSIYFNKLRLTKIQAEMLELEELRALDVPDDAENRGGVRVDKLKVGPFRAAQREAVAALAFLYGILYSRSVAEIGNVYGFAQIGNVLYSVPFGVVRFVGSYADSCTVRKEGEMKELVGLCAPKSNLIKSGCYHVSSNNIVILAFKVRDIRGSVIDDFQL